MTGPAPAVQIAPPPWFARLAVGGGLLIAVLAVAATLADLLVGDPFSALISLVGGAALAACVYDVSNRRVTSHGDVLEVRQWFRTVTLHRADLEEFAASRGALLRTDIVAVPEEGSRTRLWVTRVMTANRNQREEWLGQLEAWRRNGDATRS